MIKNTSLIWLRKNIVLIVVFILFSLNILQAQKVMDFT